LMASLIPDILEGRVSTGVSNATCNATGKMLKMLELELKYSPRSGGSATNGPGNLKLISGGSKKS
jgi:hypothetical protein